MFAIKPKVELWNMQDRFTNYDEYVKSLFNSVVEVVNKDKNGKEAGITINLTLLLAL